MFISKKINLLGKLKLEEHKTMKNKANLTIELLQYAVQQ